MQELQENSGETEKRIVPIEMRNGFPVISEDEFRKYYTTDRGALGEGVATFDFQGYVQGTGENRQTQVRYRDVFATNGLLKSETSEGIHVGTDGVVHYDHATQAMQGPNDVGEYDVYVMIPAEIQEQTGSICVGDSCMTKEEYVKAYGEEPEKPHNGAMAFRLLFDPETDPLARDKARFVHMSVATHIEQRRPLPEIGSLIQKLEHELEDISEEDLAVRQLRGY